MAKKNGNGGLFKGARADIAATRKVFNLDRQADFKVTQQGLGAIMGNALTTQNGLGKALTRQNQRTLDAMTRVSTRGTAALHRNVASGHASAADLFGSATAGDANLWRNAEGTAKAGETANKASVKLGLGLSAAGNQALSILKQGVKLDTQSAQYEVGQALSYRAKEDAKAVADMQTSLDAQRLQYRLDMKKAEQDAAYNERYLRLQAKLANGGGGGTGRGPSDNAINAGGELANFAQTPGPSSKDAAGNDVPGATPSYDAANAKAAQLILQYGLHGADALRIYNQVDALYGVTPRSAADLGLAPAHADSTSAAAPGSAGTTKTKNGTTVATPPSGIPYGEDPQKPWENQLSDKQKSEVPVRIQELYRNVELQSSDGGTAGTTWDQYDKFSNEQKIALVAGSLGLATDGKTFTKDGKTISEDVYNGYVSYGLALLQIRKDIGGTQ
jgi:hypothetical protein